MESMHLTPREIEQLAERSDESLPADRVRHLDACPRCREEFDDLRALIASVERLPGLAPERGFADSVMARVELPAPWLDRALAALPRVEPSRSFADAVMARVDLQVSWLEHALAALPRMAPAPGFAAAVMARVRLPIPWHERVWRFARRRRTALATAVASLVGVSGAGAAWLFGLQGVTLGQVGIYVWTGVRDLAIRGLLTLGRAGYELGLLDAGTAITDRISPTQALGGLGLASLAGLLAVWAMVRLARSMPPVALRLGRAA